jgi:hypothetical protein
MTSIDPFVKTGIVNGRIKTISFTGTFCIAGWTKICPIYPSKSTVSTNKILQGEKCGGFQILLLNKKKFHSLLFTLHLLRTLREFYPNEFQFLKGVYEFRSDHSAIELLAGDDKILNFLNGDSNYLELEEYFKNEETKWKKKLLEIV